MANDLNKKIEQKRLAAARQELKYSNRDVLTFLNNANVCLLTRREIRPRLQKSYVKQIQALGDACIWDLAEDLVLDNTLSWKDLSFMLAFMAMKIECKIVAGMENMPFGIFDLTDFGPEESK